ncbi:adenosylmethionine decarboxylase [Rossellomorea aquimaris]|uniref:adenosylmethionine decarboxylase n=1 Tax=Rossellomorea aquimaris TaxID=189382 RepID=UPI001CD467E9|nr:adenosylmethionine decarboxylase [Rossellomorea aquimaris]MCA1056124.1 adenosylmethionine decarboxylase [Rossellomorea aquimaris]
MEYSTFGRHIIVDLWGVDFDRLNDVAFLEKHMHEAAKASGATVLSVDYHRFDPHGVTAFVILSESHLSIHTYPEKGFAALDGYTCGHTVDPLKAINYLISVLEPDRVNSVKVVRGQGGLTINKLSLSDD